MKIDKEQFFDLCLETVPGMNFPSVGSKDHYSELKTVKYYVENNALDDDFLEESHDNVKKIFKAFCKKNKIKVNWKFVKSALNACYDFVHYLKQKHKRERPKFYLAEENDDYKKIKYMKSYSFPSGHTASAYFTCSLLSAAFPDQKTELEKLAYYVGQSRIENGVHYPTDISYGRLVGEICGDLFLEDYSKKQVIKEDLRYKEKILINDLRKNNFSKSNVADIADIIFTLFEGYITYKEIKSASNQFFQGYPVKIIKCNPLVKSFFNCLVESYYLKNEKSTIKKFIKLHKLIAESCFKFSSPGIFREKSIILQNGITTCKADEMYKFSKLINEHNSPEANFLISKWICPFKEYNNIVSVTNFIVENKFNLNSINDFFYNYNSDRLIACLKQRNLLK